MFKTIIQRVKDIYAKIKATLADYHWSLGSADNHISIWISIKKEDRP